MTINKWILENTHSLSGKTVAITGSTGGLGKVICGYVAQLNANIICIDRNEEKVQELSLYLKRKYPDLSLKHIKAELTDIQSVKTAALKLSEIEFDYLILNAGAYSVPRFICSTNYNNIFQINFISQYYLARELYPKIKKRSGKIIAVSSIAHNYSKIDLNDVDFSNRKRSSEIYGNAKRFLTYSLFNLFGNDATLSIVHPGITLTNITAHYPKIIFKLIKFPMKLLFMSPKKAALNIIYGIFCKCEKNYWIGPRVFNIWGFPKKKKLNTSSVDERTNIVNITEKIYMDLNKNSFMKLKNKIRL